MSNVYLYMPPENRYMGIWKPMLDGEEPPVYSTTVEPLPAIEYFMNKWDGDKWVYVEKPLEPGSVKNPLDKLMTYVDCRLKDYPKMEDYIDGIVKEDMEQVQFYIGKCKAVKERWPKTMEPITMREYYSYLIDK